MYSSVSSDVRTISADSSPQYYYYYGRSPVKLRRLQSNWSSPKTTYLSERTHKNNKTYGDVLFQQATQANRLQAISPDSSSTSTPTYTPPTLDYKNKPRTPESYRECTQRCLHNGRQKDLVDRPRKYGYYKQAYESCKEDWEMFDDCIQECPKESASERSHGSGGEPRKYHKTKIRKRLKKQGPQKIKRSKPSKQIHTLFSRKRRNVKFTQHKGDN